MPRGAPTGGSVVAVVAHPDDESFGLGGILVHLAVHGARVRVVCLTHGEASTLGAATDLAGVRALELAAAAAELSVDHVTLLDYADGALAAVSHAEIDEVVDRHIGDADLVVAFEPSGVTGHPDHRAATAAAERVAARRGLPVLEWGVPQAVAAALNGEFGTTFVGFDGDEVEVDRDAQWRAIRCHSSQAHDNPVLLRRLALQGDHRPGPDRVSRRRGTFASTRGRPARASVMS